MTRGHISTRERTALFLAAEERGRGVILPPKRLREVKAYCLKRMQEGATQQQIVAEIGACRSRVSRWLNAAVQESNLLSERRRLNSRRRTPVQKLFDRIQFGKTDDCWPWLGAKRLNGYGFFAAGGYKTEAHRATYEAFVGPIPTGMQIDHICRTPSCVNPHHLQPVWPSENLLFAHSRRARDAA